MDRGIFVALSGAVLQEKRLDVLTDNLANVNTAGYKSKKAVFEDAIPNVYGPRVFANAGHLITDMSQGLMDKTDRRLDMAIKGDGFFAINTPFGTRYTRDGSFTMGNNGTLVTRGGYAVQDEKGGVIKLTSADVSIDLQGNIQESGNPVDKIKVVSFDKPAFLRKEGDFFTRDNMPVKETAVSPDTQLEQGYVEVSNVNAIQAMTSMIEVSRSYEAQTKMIQTIDDMTKKVISDVGTV